MSEQAVHHGCHDDGHNHSNGWVMKEYNSTELIVRSDIMEKAKQLAELISTSDEVQTYQKAESKVNGHADIQRIISSIKKKQKEIVAFEKFNNPNMVQKIETEIDALQDELDNYPIVNEFKQTQHDINHLLQLVVNVIKDTVSDKINVESGASAPPSSCSE